MTDVREKGRLLHPAVLWNFGSSRGLQPRKAPFHLSDWGAQFTSIECVARRPAKLREAFASPERKPRRSFVPHAAASQKTGAPRPARLSKSQERRRRLPSIRQRWRWEFPPPLQAAILGYFTRRDSPSARSRPFTNNSPTDRSGIREISPAPRENFAFRLHSSTGRSGNGGRRRAQPLSSRKNAGSPLARLRPPAIHFTFQSEQPVEEQHGPRSQ